MYLQSRIYHVTTRDTLQYYISFRSHLPFEQFTKYFSLSRVFSVGFCKFAVNMSLKLTGCSFFLDSRSGRRAPSQMIPVVTRTLCCYNATKTKQLEQHSVQHNLFPAKKAEAMNKGAWLSNGIEKCVKIPAPSSVHRCGNNRQRGLWYLNVMVALETSTSVQLKLVRAWDQ